MAKAGLGVVLCFGLLSAYQPQTALIAAYAKSSHEKAASKTDKTAAKQPPPAPEAPIENVVNVTSNQLVDKPHEYLNKNVKFTAKFFAFSSLALDYKPALRSSKNYLSFLILRPEAHIPYSELKLAMAIPKDKDPANQILTSLKDGDEVEIIGKVFAASLDEPWVDVLRLKKTASVADDKKEDKTLSSSDTDNTDKSHGTTGKAPANGTKSSTKSSTQQPAASGSNNVDYSVPSKPPSIKLPISK